MLKITQLVSARSGQLDPSLPKGHMSQRFPWTSGAPGQRGLGVGGNGSPLLAGPLVEQHGLTWQWAMVLKAPDGHNKGMHALPDS